MKNNTTTPPHDSHILVDGREPIFHIIMDSHKFGLSPHEAAMQDMADEYAIVAIPEANAGIVVYAKYSGEWLANPWSGRFLIRELLGRIGIVIPPFDQQ